MNSGPMFLPTEVIFNILLAVDEPWAIHHTSRLFLALSEDEHYLFLRDTRLPRSLIIWNAIRRLGPRLSPEYLQRLLDFGAPVPLAFAQLLTNPRIPRPAPARALHAALTALEPHTRALLVAAHIRPVGGNQGFVWDALTHDDDQRVFEALFGAPSGRLVLAPAQALFDTRGFVPFCGGRAEAERGVGSLEGAFSVAFESLVQSAPNPSLLLALLSSETVCTLVATDECNLKSRLLVNALAIAGIRCAVHLLRQPAFWRPRLNMVEALLELTTAEPDISALIDIATRPSLAWPPLPSPSISDLDTTLISDLGMSGLDLTIDGIARALLGRVGACAQADDGVVWFLKYHVSMARIYEYFSKLEDEPSRVLCASIESLAYRAADGVLGSRCGQHAYGPAWTWFDSAALWSLYERFGPELKEKVLTDLSTKLSELFHGYPSTGGSAMTFAEWGMCAYLIGRLDPRDRQRVLAVLSPVGAGTAGGGEVLVPDEEVRKRLLNSGLPMALLGLA
ncbi:hypothetical protein CTheo_5390 [Ceratobasidium theobromae]|uniref:Uncharacterized protein n=1 Tax=Ceratobasidium theobromae TaxID=1582974 RepID=A0A5N5QI82_9AGAM|nr:hypothetical protein CTheo_5390 [Ceratobasidium theobromae]